MSSSQLNPQKIRELEKGIITDPAKANSLTVILKVYISTIATIANNHNNNKIKGNYEQ